MLTVVMLLCVAGVKGIYQPLPPAAPSQRRPDVIASRIRSISERGWCRYLPGHLGIEVRDGRAQEVGVAPDRLKALMAWNGFLPAGAWVTLADPCCG